MLCAFARRRSILSRTCSKVGTSSPTVADSWFIAVFICSCIFAWSSCDRSFWRSVSFFWSAAEFWATACLACSAAWVVCWSCFLRSATSRSRPMMRSAKASAACV
jgi:hypothetical protein